MRARGLCCLVSLIAACSKSEPTTGRPDLGGFSEDGGTAPVDAGDPTRWTSLRIAPDNPTLTVENGAGASMDFSLFGTHENGVEEEITSAILWRTNDTRVGSFTDETQPHFVAAGD